MRTHFSSGSTFEKDFAYSRVVADDDWVFVAGTTGYDYSTMTISSDAAVQARQCFLNIQAALDEANATLADIVRVTYLVPSRDDIAAFAPVFREFLGEVKPAATMQIVGLLDTEMKIEIEVTARRHAKPLLRIPVED